MTTNKKEEKKDGIRPDINTNGLVKEPKSRFIKVRCSKCKNEQIIFGKSSAKVDCLVCGKILCTPGGGKTKIRARVLEVLD